ncbi:hypothetical protein T07_5511 [Trichinella nelsoni]|uniref:Uncharacterized protein n=1 Tax=Trichinella nelsoni TaxID=6336 RepID=A0A0V0RF19_9BILA|nr:hypothetical protein T07_14862 [Trichinella nelsoni]KRX13386.1 hypothetical protein T07_5511 [Trichinella nelsoni]
MGTAQSCRKVVNQYHRDQAIRRKSWNSQTAPSGIALSGRLSTLRVGTYAVVVVNLFEKCPAPSILRRDSIISRSLTCQ